MNIAIIGGSGFIGGSLIQALKNCGHSLLNLDIEKPATSDIEYKRVDITQLDDVLKALKNIDIVIHLAGTVVGPVRKDPFIGVKLNVSGTRNVLESCVKNNVSKIFFASSFYVYDGIEEKIAVDEETSLDISKMELFGAIKYFCESMVKTYSKKYSLDYVIFRFGSAYGPGRCSNMVKTFLDQARNGETIDIWGPGERKSQYTYVNDIADGMKKALEKRNETYNLISPIQTSTKDLIELIKNTYVFS